MIAGMFATLLLMAQATSGDPLLKERPTPLLTSPPPAACISIPAENGMVIVLERRDVDERVQPGAPDWTTEEGRMRSTRSIHAQDILDALSDQKDALGCGVARKAGFGAFTMMELIHAGKGRVWKSAANAFLPSVDVIGYEHRDCINPGPDYQLVEPDGGTFFRETLCSVCIL